MAEVGNNNRTKTKRSSKVLKKQTYLDNDELLEHILNKKKNKTQKSIAPRRKNVGTGIRNKKSVTKKEQLSSDEIYEQIKSKRKLKKQRNAQKLSNNLDFENKTQYENNVADNLNIKNEIVDNKNDNDLIITREIRFDDLSSDLKNKKTLKELKDAIEQFDKLDTSNINTESFSDDIELLPSVKYSNYKLKKILVIVGMILLLILFFLVLHISISTFYDNRDLAKEVEEQRILEEQRKRQEEEKRKLELYNNCLSKKVSGIDMTDEVLDATNNLKAFLKKNYSVSVSYEDITHGYSFSYNENKVYYAASTIKSLAALYIYKNASEGKIDLDDTITYTSKFRVSYSEGVRRHKLGSKLTLRTLVKYSIIYSDNSAHQMLISYIGKNKLKEYGVSLGAKNTLNGGDNFGNISSNDGLIYMKEINSFIESAPELGIELKSYFVDSVQKELAVNDLVVANKYGFYKKYYHNIGIIYDESPYVISIMTLEGNKNGVKAVSDISDKIYELHELYKANRKKVCKLEVYGK